MPNCYYVVSSTPEQTGNDIVRCAADFDGRARLIGRGRRKGRYLALVWYATHEQADENLDKIKDCLEQKGHTVHDCDVIQDITELGITVEGYEPYPEPGSTSS